MAAQVFQARILEKKRPAGEAVLDAAFQPLKSHFGTVEQAKNAGKMSFVIPALRFARIGVRNFGGQLAHDKFLKQVGRCSCANPDPRIFEGESGSIAILRRIVEI